MRAISATKIPLNIFQADICIFYHIMKEGANSGTHAESDLFNTNTAHGKGMQDIGLTAFTTHGFMRLSRHFKGIPDMLLIARFQFWFQRA